MKCQRAQDILVDLELRDPDLSFKDKNAFFGHLKSCTACHKEYEQGLKLIELIQAFGQLSPDTIHLLNTHDIDHDEAERIESNIDEKASLARFMMRIDAIESEKNIRIDLHQRINVLKIDPATIAQQRVEHEVSMRHRRWRLPTQTVEDVPPPNMFFGKRLPAWSTVTKWVACLALMALIGLALPSTHQPNGSGATPQYNYLTSNTRIEQVLDDGTLLRLASDQPITCGDTQTRLVLGGRHHIVLNQNTDVRVAAHQTLGTTDPAWKISLTTGELYAEVVPGSRFTVATTNALATITGTKFNLRAHNDSSELTLLKGSVRFARTADSNNGISVDVTAGHASVIEGHALPTTPYQTDALAVTAWARQDILKIGHPLHVADVSAAKSGLLDEIQNTALTPNRPDYRAWSYERFRDELRPWFATQFPWAMELEDAINQQQPDVNADYLDILMISGDLWWFEYPNTHSNPQTKQPTPSPTANNLSLERLGNWYDVDTRTLSGTTAWNTDARSRNSSTAPDGEHLREALNRWRLDASNDGVSWDDTDAAWCFLRASTYLAHTQQAALMWCRSKPEQAARLIQDPSYVRLWIAPSLFSDPTALLTVDQWVERLESRAYESRSLEQISLERLTVPDDQECAITPANGRIHEQR